LDKLEIRWPSGKKEIVSISGLNRIVTVIEGKGESEKPGNSKITTRKK
jgi:hypothetical protein